MSEFTDSAQSKQIDQQEHNSDAQAKRVVLRAQDPVTGEFVNIGAVDGGDGYGIATSDTPLSVRIDDTTTADTIYIGRAPIGSATSSAVWQIQKLDESSGLVKTWADGDSLFDNVWGDPGDVALLNYQ